VAEKQELEISIDDDGNVSIKVIGGDGASCVELTKEIEEALGVVVDRQRTSEYYKDQTQTQNQVDQQGQG
jgi:hypothetical protein